ncbi:hypothetical protein [Ferrovum myxofaciens]|jgi:hypothetical protein|uniref:Uncharacterized protein n=2 Tax=Ferrovum myxofaciens TaxID=416213 RepID=A0A898C7F6_9PROT|nr:hypothetical protein [Ferrovum myxofaciens]KXW57286.1 hypothetical protein FEMY_21970 [Ferrovum myxofaciens]MBU6993820.1 hypothetical protein [Ferrovum myxofaciens]QSH81955.1 MAG: hypothetical protein HO273_13875 [Ferrovum myxofaciens]QWY78895.1 MAG: hypothetical protein JZL65_03750 [Ferrovum myxofaciens]
MAIPLFTNLSQVLLAIARFHNQFTAVWVTTRSRSALCHECSERTKKMMLIVLGFDVEQSVNVVIKKPQPRTVEVSLLVVHYGTEPAFDFRAGWQNIP